MIQPTPAGLPPLARFAHAAMATTFEIHIAGQEAEYARQATAAAFVEIDRLEGRLSRFIENSDIAALGRLAGREAVRLDWQTFECLRIARTVSGATGGAFDITVGALRDCWRPGGGPPFPPTPEALAEALAATGMDLLELDEAALTARLCRAGAGLDLGAIGKGYAVDQTAAVLKDWGIEAALIGGGGSSVLALGAPEGCAGWPLGVGFGAESAEGAAGRVVLRDQALGASGTAVQGRHIFDPRTGYPPAAAAVRTWVINPSAAVADALSTAFMVLRPAEVEACCRQFADVAAMLLIEAEGGPPRLLRFGPWPGCNEARDELEKKRC